MEVPSPFPIHSAIDAQSNETSNSNRVKEKSLEVNAYTKLEGQFVDFDERITASLSGCFNDETKNRSLLLHEAQKSIMNAFPIDELARCSTDFIPAAVSLTQMDTSDRRFAGLVALSAISKALQLKMSDEDHLETIRASIQSLTDSSTLNKFIAYKTLLSTDLKPHIEYTEKIIPTLFDKMIDSKCGDDIGKLIKKFMAPVGKETIASSDLDIIMRHLTLCIDLGRKRMADGDCDLIGQTLDLVRSCAERGGDGMANYTHLNPSIRQVGSECPQSNEKLRMIVDRCVSALEFPLGDGKTTHDVDEAMMHVAWHLDALIGGKHFVRDMKRLAAGMEDKSAMKHMPFLVSRLVAHAPVDDSDPLNEDFVPPELELIDWISNKFPAALVAHVDDVIALAIRCLQLVCYRTMTWSLDMFGPLVAVKMLQKGTQGVNELWQAYFKVFKEQIYKGDTTGSMAIHGMEVCAEELDAEVLTCDDWKEIGGMLRFQLRQVLNRLKGEAKKAKKNQLAGRDVDFDFYDATLESISMLVFAGFEALGSSFFNIVSPMMRDVFAVMSRVEIWGYLIIALLVERAPQRAIIYKPDIGRLVIEGLAHDDDDVRFLAVNTIAVMAESAVPGWLEVAGRAAAPLTNMLNRPDAQSTERSSEATRVGITAAAIMLKDCEVDSPSANMMMTCFLFDWLKIAVRNAYTMAVCSLLIKIFQDMYDFPDYETESTPLSDSMLPPFVTEGAKPQLVSHSLAMERSSDRRTTYKLKMTWIEDKPTKKEFNIRLNAAVGKESVEAAKDDDKRLYDKTLVAWKTLNKIQREHREACLAAKARHNQ